MKKSTAILIFSRTARAEAKEKSYLPHNLRKKNKLVAEAFIHHTKKIAQQTGLTVFHVDESIQVGDSFGERFANSFQLVFNKGFENVIAIGNDSPNLTTQLLKKAVAQVKKDTIVLGPTKHAGTYLIGLNRANFEVKRMAELPWQKPQLLGTITEVISKKELNQFLFPVLDDVNNKIDLFQLFESTKKKTWFDLLIQNLIETTQIFASISKSIQSKILFKANVLRGPPTCSIS